MNRIKFHKKAEWVLNMAWKSKWQLPGSVVLLALLFGVSLQRAQAEVTLEQSLYSIDGATFVDFPKGGRITVPLVVGNKYAWVQNFTSDQKSVTIRIEETVDPPERESDISLGWIAPNIKVTNVKKGVGSLSYTMELTLLPGSNGKGRTGSKVVFDKTHAPGNHKIRMTFENGTVREFFFEIVPKTGQ
ncbi:MAG: hypothetical protein KDD43_00105 [Bdellovibrionales bacterium]|nr:hypothetical protein [Bdellovibrionales bacterium]